MHVLSSTLDRVKLYATGATVYRTLTIEKSAGGWPSEIEVPHLPLALADHSVRLFCLSHPNEVRILRGRVGIHVAPREHDFDTPQQETLQRIERQLHRKNTITEDLTAEITFFESFSVPPRPNTPSDRPPPASPMLARLSLTTFMNDAIAKREEQLRRLRREIATLEREKKHMEETIARHSNAQQARVSDLSKSFMAQLHNLSNAESIECQLEYFIPGARWVPQYQCHIARDGSQARLLMRALVVQNSGEDWRNVHLSLSTAQPTQWTALPKLNAIRIGKRQPPPPRQAGFRPPPVGADLLFQDVDRDHQQAKRTTPSAQLIHEPTLHANAPQTFAQAMLELQIEPLEADEVYDEEPMYEEAEEYGAFDDDMASTLKMDIMEAAPKPQARMRAKKMSRPAPAPTMAAAMAPPAPGGAAYKIGGMATEADAFGGNMNPTQPSSYAQLRLGGPYNSSQRNKLHPIDTRQHYQRSFNRAGLQAGADLMSLVEQASQRARSASQVPLPNGARDVRAEAASFDYLYQTRDRVDVVSDGTYHSIPVDERQMQCALNYVVVPRLDTQVYRMAALTNPSRAPLLAGQAEIYVGGEFVLTTQLHTVAPNAEFKLGLGVEQSIRCARNTTFKEVRSGNAVVATSELWHTISIELSNQLGHDVHCEVRERIPQPAPDAEVVVEEAHIEPKWTDWNQVEERKRLHGGKRWHVTLEAGKRTTLSAQYVVKIYANNELVGGNRREQ